MSYFTTPTSNNEPLSIETAALAYIAANIPIFPLNGKQPYEAGGFHTATTDPERIDQWMQAYPGCNWGMPTGQRSGFDVLDIDRPVGRQSLEAWEDEHGSLPNTIHQRTGSGGLHYLFESTGQVRNSAKAMAAGWDTRGDGGYIVIAPSIHPETDLPYKWLVSPLEMREAAPWPTELIEAYLVGKRDQREALDHLEKIPLGVQEDTLTRKAGQMRHNRFSEEEILAALMVMGTQRCDPPMGEENIRRIAKSIGGRALGGQEIAKERHTRGGFARVFVNLYQYEVRYVAKWKSFIVWDGKRWQPDEDGAAMRKMTGLVTGIYEQASRETDDATRKGLVDWARSMDNDFAPRGALDLVKTAAGVPVGIEQLDADPWLFNLRNGTLDLRTGAFHPHDPKDFITKLAPLSYDAEAECLVWESYLRRAMNGDEEMIGYLQRMVGIFLTGDVSEKFQPIVYGGPNTGKTTFANVLRSLLGDDYSTTITEATLAKTGRPTSGSEASPDLADLLGARLGIASETSAGLRLNEARVKAWTGREKLKARKLFQDPFEFYPTHKLLIETNEKPVIDASDSAMWDRVHLIPFHVEIPKAERDRQLDSKLIAELPGVLAWAVKGCLAWQTEGLTKPSLVIEETDDYQREMNPLDAFFTSQCEFGDGKVVETEVLFNAYREWEIMRHTPQKSQLGRNKFSSLVRQRVNHSKFQDPENNRAQSWRGIAVNPRIHASPSQFGLMKMIGGQ